MDQRGLPEQAGARRPAIFGIALILLMYVLPDGIVGGLRRLGRVDAA